MSQIQSSPQALTATIIDTSTRRIVTALFEQYTDALEAQTSLERQGFTREDIQVFAPDEVHTAGTNRIVPALVALGIPHDVASYYQVDVHAGMTLITVVANERSQDVLNFLRGQSEGGMNRATERVLQDVEEHVATGPTSN